MELFLKITATLLLLALSFQGALVEEVTQTTDTPWRTIDKTWLRNPVPSSNQTTASDWPTNDDQTQDESGLESGNDMSGGMASGYLSITEENITDTTDQPPTFPSSTTLAPENHDPVTTNAPTSDGNIGIATNFDSYTTTPGSVDVTPQNTTDSNSNDMDVQTTTSGPETKVTTQDSGVQFTTVTENDPTTTVGVVIPETTVEEHITESESSTASPPTTASPEEPSTTVPLTTTPVLVTLEQANLADKGAADTEERGQEKGYASESDKRARKSAWGAVLGTFVAIAVVGLVAYVILKKKHQKAFSHRKLQEEFPSDPVLRLDNSEPLDLNFGRAAYYNPALQGDNIQMSPFPKN